MDIVRLQAAERHRRLAADFATIMDAVEDWDAPTTEEDWTARNMVEHVLTWFPQFLATAGVHLEPVDFCDLPRAWKQRSAEVQSMLDRWDADRPFIHPQHGMQPLCAAIDRSYTLDIYSHCWDLAQADGVWERLSPEFVAYLESTVRPREESLHPASRGPLAPAEFDPVANLMKRIGRQAG